jgi:hypothetical protein
MSERNYLTSEEAIDLLKAKIVEFMLQSSRKWEATPLEEDTVRRIVDTIVGDEKNYAQFLKRLAVITSSVELAIEFISDDDIPIAIELS